jgi:hypothetical protein
MSTVVFRGRFSRSQPRILGVGLANLKNFQFASVIVAVAVMGFLAGTAQHHPVLQTAESAVALRAPAQAERSELAGTRALAAALTALAQRERPLFHQASLESPATDQSRVDDERLAAKDFGFDPGKRNFRYLAFYPYAEIPIAERPADLVLASLKDVPVGTPVEEIRRAAEAFGIDVTFMKAVAKIESDFDPKQRTGSYIGLFQLSHYEFRKYGSGDILNARDNAIAAAYKFLTEADLFEWDTHKRPTFSDLYLIHQQGWQGAAEHVAHPDRIAWKSMCATDEGREKGEKWCKRAVWGNTLPTVKHVWKSVENMTSAAFVAMWQQRITLFYSRYSAAANADPKR